MYQDKVTDPESLAKRKERIREYNRKYKQFTNAKRNGLDPSVVVGDFVAKKKIVYAKPTAEEQRAKDRIRSAKRRAARRDLHREQKETIASVRERQSAGIPVSADELAQVAKWAEDTIKYKLRNMKLGTKELELSANKCRENLGLPSLGVTKERKCLRCDLKFQSVNGLRLCRECHTQNRAYNAANRICKESRNAGYQS